jgi:hypothetical protein
MPTSRVCGRAPALLALFLPNENDSQNWVRGETAGGYAACSREKAGPTKPVYWGPNFQSKGVMPLGVSNPMGLQLIGNGSLFDPFIGRGSGLSRGKFGTAGGTRARPARRLARSRSKLTRCEPSHSVLEKVG